MADCGKVSNEGSSSDRSSPTPPSKCKNHAKKPPVTAKYHKHKHGRKGKRKHKEKRKLVTSSSSASSTSHDSTDSESPDITPKNMNPKLSAKVRLFDIFRKHYVSLVKMTRTCVNTFTDELYSENLVSERSSDYWQGLRWHKGIKSATQCEAETKS